MANPNPAPEHRFKKGDPRINRNGRPKTFDAVCALAQQIAHETAKVGGNDMVIDGHKVTVTEAILRSWAMSKDPKLQMAFMEWAYGKVPNAAFVTQETTQKVTFDVSQLPAEVLRAIVDEGKRGSANSGVEVTLGGD